MPIDINNYTDIKIGDIYEDCAYHPCICVKIDSEIDEISGISLIDGTFPKYCSIKHCGIRKLTLEEAIEWKLSGPSDVVLDNKNKWWGTIIE